MGTLLLAAMVLLVPHRIEQVMAAKRDPQVPQQSSVSQAALPPQESSAAQQISSSQNAALQEGTIPEPEDVQSCWELILVNDLNPLPEDFVVALVPAGGGEQVDYRIQQPLEQMIAGAQAQGIELMVCSGYRNVAYQQTLYERKAAAYQSQGLALEEAQEEAKRWVARPGCSEHHTGLAVDIVTPAYQVLDSGFAGTSAAQWMAEHCAEYGFILRYPQGKEEVTGVCWEPWHFRYVGTEAAGQMSRDGLCLEEFLQK